ncbi:L,D-transpeptidase family protein [Photobacterium galatheae]|uniref:Peptidoglycan-binding protein n=1 Tax=Photobacterium galatheae TaxID=1654360 RepID=A0A066RMW5_9GAMM|nr:L,D-transpeptidase family protein [Photobacterium galatheae]KDM91785.1 peptidoglycan-binding protein [Photobacterium galatheae]MCM0147121.1 L,D-transpeptidase family protein [Photobacterium galatheae]
MTRLGRIGLLLLVGSVSLPLQSREIQQTGRDERTVGLAVATVASVAEQATVADPAMRPAMPAEAAQALTPDQIQAEAQAAELAKIRQKSLAWVNEVSSNLPGLRYRDQLAGIYHGLGYVPLWQDSFTVTEFEKQLWLLNLAQVSPDFDRRLRQLRHLKQANDWRQYDLLATDTLLAYLSFIEHVRDSRTHWLFGEAVPAQIPAPSDQTMSTLMGALERDQLNQFVSSLKPAGRQYQQLLQAIQRMERLAEQPWPVFSQGGIIRLGAWLRNPDSLITILERLGDLTPYQAEQLRSSGKKHYNVDLVQAVKHFQQRHGLKVDGAIGPQTRAWLSVTPQQRIRLLAMNAQRSRVWVSDYPSRLVVNIPGFALKLWLDNQPVFDARVIVGQPKRPTPVMSSRIAAVVFNPYWNVPNSILRKDILPKVRYDVGYLYRHHYDVLRGWNSNEKIPISSINWRYVSAKNFPYRLRQQPGAHNALGRFKFNIPNNKSIYLHDTPSKSLFNKDVRAFSSGCIRVQGADELAKMLLTYAGVSEERFTQLAGRRSTRTVGVKPRIEVHLIYQTAWVDDQGLVNYREDVYRYDDQGKNSPDSEKLAFVYKN